MTKGIVAGVVAVTGASGFVGRHMVKELLARGYSVRALVRDLDKAREALPVTDPRLTLVNGNVLDAGKCDELVKGCGACINLVGIIREAPGGQTFKRMHVEATRAAVKACEGAGVARFIQMSALGVTDLGVCEYQSSKWEAEEILRGSTLEWTIFRPGMIHGPESEFLDMVAGFASGLEMPWIFLPYFRRGKTDKRVPMGGDELVDPVVAPVHVDDVCAAFVSAIANERTIGEIYNLVGPQELTWPEILVQIRDGTGGNPSLKPWGMPASLAALKAMALKQVGLGQLLPFDAGMALMGAEDAVSEMGKAREHLRLEFRPFTKSFLAYAGELRAAH